MGRSLYSIFEDVAGDLLDKDESVASAARLYAEDADLEPNPRAAEEYYNYNSAADAGLTQNRPEGVRRTHPEFNTSKALNIPEKRAFFDWYEDIARKTGLNPDPYAPDHQYDYEAAYNAGVRGPDESGRWPSQFKAEDHPSRDVDGVDTITGEEPQDPASATRKGLVDIYNKIAQPEKLPESRFGIAGDIGSGLAGAVLDMGAMPYKIARAFDKPGGSDVVRNWATKNIELIGSMETMYPEIFKPSKQTQDSEVRKGVYQGLRSLGPSAFAAALGMLGGGLPGLALVAAGAFGAQEFDDFIEDARKAGISYDEAFPFALASAGVEGGFEGLFDVIGAKIFGFTSETALNPFKKTVKDMLTKNLGYSLKRYLTALPVEVVPEIIQNSSESALRRLKDIPADHPLRAGADAIIPAIVMTTVFGGVGGHFGRQQRQAIQSALTDADANPKDRMAAAKAVQGALEGKDKDLSGLWGQLATEHIKRGLPVPIEEATADYMADFQTKKDTIFEGNVGRGLTSDADVDDALTRGAKAAADQNADPITRAFRSMLDSGKMDDVDELKAFRNAVPPGHPVTRDIDDILAQMEKDQAPPIELTDVAQEQRNNDYIQYAAQIEQNPELISGMPIEEYRIMLEILNNEKVYTRPVTEAAASFRESVEGEAVRAVSQELGISEEEFRSILDNPGVPEVDTGRAWEDLSDEDRTFMEMWDRERSQHDREAEGRISRGEREGQEPRGAVPEPGAGTQETGAGGVFQAPEAQDRGKPVGPRSGAEYLESIQGRPPEGPRPSQTVEATQTPSMGPTALQRLRGALYGKKGRLVEKKEGEPSTAKIKEPWEMTREEFEKQPSGIRNDYDMPLVVYDEGMGKPPILAWKGSDVNIGDQINPVKGARLHVYPNAKKPVAYPPNQGRRDLMRPATHEDIIRNALRSGELTPAQYAELHEADYGPLEKFAPDVTPPAPTPIQDVEGAVEPKKPALDLLAELKSVLKTDQALTAEGREKLLADGLIQEGKGKKEGKVVLTAAGLKELGRLNKGLTMAEAVGAAEPGVDTEQKTVSATPTTPTPVTKENILDLFDHAVAEAEKPIADGNPRTPAVKDFTAKVARKKLAEAGEHMQAVVDLIGQMNDILGEGGEVGPGAQIDETKWQRIKPLLKEAWEHTIAAGKSAAEFVEILVKGGLRASARPYLSRFLDEQMAEREIQEEEIEDVEAVEPGKIEDIEGAAEPEDAGEREITEEEIEAAEPGKEGEAQLPKEKPEKKRKRKIQDVGEVLGGKRSSKDHRERVEAISIELDKALPANASGKRILDALKRITSKSGLFKIEPVEGATAGVQRYREAVRNVIPNFVEFAGRKAGGGRGRRRVGFSEAVIRKLDDEIAAGTVPREYERQLRQFAATYVAIVERVAEVTQNAVNVGIARDALFKLWYKEGSEQDVIRTASYREAAKFLSEYGEATSKLIYQSDMEHLLFRTAGEMIAKEDEETKDLPIVRKSHRILDIKTSGKHRDGKDVSPEKLMEIFGLRGVDFGEWAEAAYRQQSVNLTFDSFYDMMDILGAPAKGISLPSAEMPLGIGYGARGRGGKTAAAFYPANCVIGLTKTKGDGSLAHEWGHALDHMSKLTLGDNVDPEVHGYTPMDDLKHALKYRYDLSNMENEVYMLLKGLHTRSRQGRDRLAEAKKFLQDEWERHFVTKTHFFKDAVELDGGNPGDYWSQPEEMFARAFEAFICDSLKEENLYLVDATFVGPGAVEALFNRQYGAYPRKEEREYFNDLFRRFFDGVKWDKYGRPTMKPDYVPVTIQDNKKTRAAIQKMLDKLEEIYNNLYKGEASKDGLYWYAYKATAFGPTMQPDGAMAHDDEYRHEAKDGEDAVSGQGAVAYEGPLIADDVIAFGLMPIVHEKSGTTLYIGVDDGQSKIGSMVAGEAALGEVSSKDGETPETTGDIRTGSGRDGGEGDGRTGGDAQGGGGPRGGEGNSIETVDIPPIGGGDADTAPGSNALQSAGKLIDYSITPTDGLSEKVGIANRFANNLAAIKTLKQLESEQRLATPEEQKILVKFSGWGGLGGILEYHPSDTWKTQNDMLRRVMTEEEVSDARANVLNAFYTPPEAYEGMWRVLERFGFMGGRIIDPSIGTGNSIGTMPVEMRSMSSITGVDLDSISARIARQLYQSIGVMHEDFAKAQLPEGYYDLFITNVPFGDEQLHDRKHNPLNFNIHDHFINKGLALLRPGGVMAVITSTGTMDKKKSKARELWAEDADFIGAIRLPNTIFASSSSTVGADILFLRKKSENVPAVPEQKWTNVTSQQLPTVDRNNNRSSQWEHYADLNEYWTEHPKNVLGEMVITESWRGDRVQAVGGIEDVGKRIDEIAKTFPENIYIQDQTTHHLDIAGQIPAPSFIKDNSIYEGENGEIYTFAAGVPVPYKFPKDDKTDKRGRVKGMIKLRGIVRQLLKASAIGDTANADLFRKSLNSTYDKFEKKYGWLNSGTNYKLFSWDPDVGLLMALEKWDRSREVSKGKEAIFSQDYIAEIQEPTSAENGVDALIQSLNWRGRVDLSYMSKLTGRDRDVLTLELQGRIFNDPQRGYVTTDEYLSGDVREKLRAAEAAAKIDNRFDANVEALKAVLPEDLPPHKIRAGLGAPWVPVDYIHDFAMDLMDYRTSEFRIEFVPELGRYNIVWTGYNKAEAKRNKQFAYGLTEATSKWGTHRVHFWRLLDYALNGGFPRVTDPGPNNTDIFNQQATDAALTKLSQIKDKFESWIWQDDDRMKAMVQGYNDMMNAMVDRKYDGSHLTLPGKAPDAIIQLRPHQKNAVWRFIQGGIAYFGHEVGTGKTFSIISSVMEARRLGLAKKPLIAILKSNLPDYQASFQKLYPTANVLYLKVPDNKKLRKKIFSRIATGNYDAIVITHKALNKLPVSPESIARTINNEVRKLEAAMIQAQQAGAGGPTLRDIQRAMRKLRSKMQGELDKARDDVPTMEEMGIDMLVVDEAHVFKNLMFTTRYQNVKGINTEGAERSMDLLSKIDYLRQRYGRNVLLASGTPLTNSVAELYTISRYLHPEELDRRGITQFDAWAATFGRIESDTETSPEGGGFQQVTKFKRFVNIPEMMQMARKHLDLIRVVDDKSKEGPGAIYIPRPKIAGGKPESVVVPQNQYVEALQLQLKHRAAAIRSEGKDAEWMGKQDIMFRVIHDGRNMAIDPRMYNPNLWDDGDTKINYMVSDLVEDYNKSYPAVDLETGKKYTETKPVFLVFLDRGVPGKDRAFNAYADIRDKLVAHGIPKDEIAFIHDAKNDNQRRALFSKTNEGKIRVLIGSTDKLGTGTNVQKRVAGIYHLDVHWNFANYEQRNGRGLRFGNVMEQIFIKNYGTEGTVDAFMWDKNASKGFTLGQVLNYNPQVREIEDISQDTMTASEFVAALSGDPLHKEQIDLQSRVRQLKNARAVWDDSNRRMRYQIATAPAELKGLEESVERLSSSLADLQKITAIQIGEDFWELKKDGGKANAAAEKIAKNAKVIEALKKDHTARKTVGQFGYVTEEDVTYYEDVIEKVKNPETGKVEEVKKSVQKSKKVKKFNPTDSWLKLAPVILGDIQYQVALPGGVRDYYEVSGGISRAVTTFTNRTEKSISDKQEDISRLQDEIPRLEAEIKKPFEHETELSEKEQRLQDVTQTLVERQQEQQQQMRAGGASEEQALIEANRLLGVGDDDTPRLSTWSPPPGETLGVPVRDLQNLALDMVKNWANPPEIVVVKSQPQLPAAVLRNQGNTVISGAYHGDTVYLVSDNTPSLPFVIQTIAHEAWGHKGFDLVREDPQLRPDFDRFLDRLYASKQDELDRIADQRGFDTGTAEGRYRSADEWLARQAEKKPNDPWIIRAVALVKRWLAKVFPGLKVSHAEVASWLGEMRRAVVEGKSDIGTGARDATNPDVRYQLAGKRAIGAPTGQLAKAQEMAEQGKGEQEIWDATGWTKEASGKWAFRIDDSGAELKNRDEWVRLCDGHSVLLKEILDHPNLYKAYPQLEKLQVVTRGRMDARGGWFSGDSISVNLMAAEDFAFRDNPDRAMTTLLHEVQHAIQHIEGFAEGGNPDSFHTPKGHIQPRKEAAPFKKAAASVWKEVVTLRKTPEYKKDKARYDKLVEDNKHHDADSFRSNSIPMQTEDSLFDKMEELKDKAYQIVASAAKKEYRRLSGEIYAREAGSLYPGLPGTMEGIPRDQWIVKDGEGTSFSVEQPSDIGEPRYSLRAPGQTPEEWAKEFLKGYIEAQPEAKKAEVKKAIQKEEKAFDKQQHDNALDGWDAVKRFFERDPEGWAEQKPDFAIWQRILSQPSHYFHEIPAMGRVFDAAMQSTDNRQRLTDQIVKAPDGSYYTKDLGDLRKSDRAAYHKLQEYLKHRDQNKIGYSIAKNEETGNWDLFGVKDKKTPISTFTKESEAVDAMIQAEADDYRKAGAYDAAVKALVGARRISNNGFNILFQAMRDLEAYYFKTGQEMPKEIVTVDGKQVEVDLKLALAQMGDMRGYYMPRIRRPGRVVGIATKKGEHPVRQHFDTKTLLKVWQVGMERKGYAVTKDTTSRMPEDVFELAGKVVAQEAIIQEALNRIRTKKYTLADFGLEAIDRRLGPGKRDYMVKGPTSRETNALFKRMGGRYYESDKGGPRVWHFENPGAHFENRLAKAIAMEQAAVEIDTQTRAVFAKALTEQVANVIKGRGSRMHMIRRADATGLDVWEGYEEDPAIAMAKYARGVAAGEAKKIMAHDMLMAFSGTDVSWAQFQELNGEATYEDYLDFVEQRRVDPVKQTRAFRDGKSYIEDMLRNEEAVDRLIGTVKGIAVLKYLGGRVSAPVVNLTALATSVPAAMNGFASIPLHKTMGYVIKASKLYGQYKFGDKAGLSEDVRALFDEIEANGWHNAQLNREALAVLRGKMGRTWDNIIDLGMIGFGVTEQLNRVATIAGTYLGMKEQGGADHEAMLKTAKYVSDQAHGTYGKVNYPMLARGGHAAAQVIKSFYVFKNFSHNYLLTMKDLWGPGWTPEHGKAFLYMAASPAVLAGAGAFVGAPIVKGLLKGLGVGGDDPEEGFYDWLLRTFGQWAETLGRYGLAGLVGINIKGSLDIGIADLPTDLEKLGGAPWSVVKDLWEGGKLITKGDTMKGIERMAPLSLAAPVKAYREATEGLTTKTNAPIWWGTQRAKADPVDTALRSLSFNPAKIARIREKKWAETQQEERYRQQRSEIQARINKFVLTPAAKRDPETAREIQQDADEYNRKIRDAGLTGIIPQITPKSVIQNLLRNFRPARKEVVRRFKEERAAGGSR